MITVAKNTKLVVLNTALQILNRDGITLEKLRIFRENYILNGGPQDEIDQLYYDAILAAIEMLTNPMFD